MCMDFILRIEVLALLQRNKLNSPDYHELTDMKDNIGQNSLLQSNVQLQLLVPFILKSHILTEQ